MKLLTYRTRQGGSPRVGVMLDDKRLAPLSALDMVALIAAGRKAIRIPKGRAIALSSTIRPSTYRCRALAAASPLGDSAAT